MKIDDLQIDRTETGTSISALIDNQRVSLRYNQALDLVESGDAFVVIAIAIAMERKEELIVAPAIPISPSLLTRLRIFQEVYTAWWPQVLPTSIEAKNQKESPQSRVRTGCFFSGGIDSIFSAMRHRETLDDLILCRGLDIPFDEKERWAQTVQGVTEFAKALNLNMLCIETNAKSNFSSSRGDNHGALLISTAIPVGFKRLIVPSSHSYQHLFAWGSHPITDPLLSSVDTEVIHDGAVPRSEKVRFIVQSGVNIDRLRVCNRFTMYNCGECEKCMRTKVALEIIGAGTPSLSALNIRMISRVDIQNVSALDFWQDNLAFARANNRTDIAREIEKAISRYTLREGLRTFDRRWFGGVGLGLLRSVRRSLES